MALGSSAAIDSADVATTAATSTSEPASSTSVVAGDDSAGVANTEAAPSDDVGATPEGNASTAQIGVFNARLEGTAGQEPTPEPNGGNVVTLATGDQARVALEGVEPLSEVEVVIYSTPRLLGLVTADEFGRVLASLPLPRDLEVGMHTIVLSGRSADGIAIRVEFPVYVIEKAPGASASWVALGAMAVLGALVAGVAARLMPGRVKRALRRADP